MLENGLTLTLLLDVKSIKGVFNRQYKTFIVENIREKHKPII